MKYLKLLSFIGMNIKSTDCMQTGAGANSGNDRCYSKLLYNSNAGNAFPPQ